MDTNNALQEVMSSPSLSKTSQTSIAQSLVQQVITGCVDPMQAFIQIKAISEVCDMFLKNEEIVNLTTGAVASCGKEIPGFNGAKVALVNTTRYDYESSQDSEYNELIRQKKEIDTKLKAREMFLKAIDESVDFIDKVTGEVRTIFAPTKKQSQTLRVTFAKQ